MGTRFFIIGVIAILIGFQLRSVESFVLTQKASTFVENRLRSAQLGPQNPYDSLLMTAGPTPQKTIQHPRWLGWAMLSVGAVLVLHGISIRKL